MMNLMDGKSIKKIIKIDSFKSPEIFYKKKEINILNTSCLKMSEAWIYKTIVLLNFLFIGGFILFWLKGKIFFKTYHD